VHTHHQHFLVVRTVEDADPAALRQLAPIAPQVVVIQVELRRLLNDITCTPCGLTRSSRA